MQILRVPYTTWSGVVGNNSFDVYHQVVAGKVRLTWAGNSDFIYHTEVDAETFTAYNTNYEPSATVVGGEDDALAHIIGLSEAEVAAVVPRAVDGTPITATRSLVLGQAAFTRTDDGTTIMHINGTAAGTPVVMWNGTGGSDTGGDWTPSAQGSETEGSNHSGTNGWDTGVTSAGNLTKFDGGANQDIAGTYDELSFWMQPKAYPVGSNLQVRWKTSGGGNAGGAKLDIANYVVNFDLDVWQKITIPVADFGLTADVDKLQFKFSSQGGQHFWFDDLELNNSAGGGPFVFQVAAPDTSVQYHLTMAVLVVSASDVGWSPTAFANIVSGLSNGLLLRQRKISTGEIMWSINSRDNVDLFGRFHPQDDIVFSDGTLLVGFMIKPGGADVSITDDTVLEVVVRDDLSSLTTVRAYAHYGVEVVA